MMTPSQEACFDDKENLTCTNIISQYADVNVPLKLKPYATVGNLATECCGEPIVTLRPCSGANPSCGCELIITQSVCIKIPIAYGADADIGDTAAMCKRNLNAASISCR